MILPISSDIDLSLPLSDEDLKTLERDAKKAEKIAERLAKKVKEKKAKIAQALIDLKLSEDRLRNTSPLGSLGGSTLDDEYDPSNSGFGGIGVNRNLASKPRDQTSAASTQTTPWRFLGFPNPQSYYLYLKEQRLDYIKSKQSDNDTKSAIINSGNQVRNIVQNPASIIGMGTGLATRLPYVGVAIGAAKYIYEFIRQQYGPGGLFDIRKTVLDVMQQISNLNHILQIDRGVVFFTSNSSEIIRQGLQGNGNTNTRNLVYGQDRYIQTHSDEVEAV